FGGLPRPHGRSGQAERGSRGRLHRGDRTVSPLHRLPADDARHRARVAPIGCGRAPMTEQVRQSEVPPSALALSTLTRVDYCDAFLFEVGSSHDESPEDLIREVLEGAPLTVRTQLLSGWSTIGLKVSS